MFKLYDNESQSLDNNVFLIPFVDIKTVKTETIDGKNLELVINWECAKKEYHVLNLHTEELEDAEMLVQGIRLLQEEAVAIP